jgi:hypothetical protein
MDTQFEHQRPPNGLAEQKTADELVKLIRKLRWMGMDDEAQRMQTTVASYNVQTVSSVIDGPDDTD